MIPPTMQNIAAHQLHPDMGTFVGALSAILLCATFWDEPRKGIVAWQAKRGKKYIENSKTELLSIPAAKSSLLEQLEDIEDDFAEGNRKIQSVIDWCYKWLYTPAAVILGLLALAELYFGKVQALGYWNAILLIPFLLFLVPTLAYILWRGFWFWIKKKSFENRLAKISKKTQKRANNIMELLNEQKK